MTVYIPSPPPIWVRAWRQLTRCLDCYDFHWNRLCEPAAGGHPFVHTNARTGVTTRGIRPRTGCEHKHHDSDVAFA